MKRKSIVVLLVLLLVGILAFTAFACNNNKNKDDDDKKPPVEEKPDDETPSYLNEALPALINGVDNAVRELASIEDEAYIGADLSLSVIVGEGEEAFDLDVALSLKASLSEKTTAKNWAFVEIAIGGDEGNTVALFAEAASAGEEVIYLGQSLTDAEYKWSKLSQLDVSELAEGSPIVGSLLTGEGGLISNVFEAIVKLQSQKVSSEFMAWDDTFGVLADKGFLGSSTIGGMQSIIAEVASDLIPTSKSTVNGSTVYEATLNIPSLGGAISGLGGEIDLSGYKDIIDAIGPILLGLTYDQITGNGSVSEDPDDYPVIKLIITVAEDGSLSGLAISYAYDVVLAEGTDPTFVSLALDIENLEVSTSAKAVERPDGVEGAEEFAAHITLDAAVPALNGEQASATVDLYVNPAVKLGWDAEGYVAIDFSDLEGYATLSYQRGSGALVQNVMIAQYNSELRGFVIDLEPVFQLAGTTSVNGTYDYFIALDAQTMYDNWIADKKAAATPPAAAPMNAASDVDTIINTIAGMVENKKFDFGAAMGLISPVINAFNSIGAIFENTSLVELPDLDDNATSATVTVRLVNLMSELLDPNDGLIGGLKSEVVKFDLYNGTANEKTTYTLAQILAGDDVLGHIVTLVNSLIYESKLDAWIASDANTITIEKSATWIASWKEANAKEEDEEDADYDARATKAYEEYVAGCEKAMFDAAVAAVGTYEAYVTANPGSFVEIDDVYAWAAKLGIELSADQSNLYEAIGDIQATVSYRDGISAELSLAGLSIGISANIEEYVAPATDMAKPAEVSGTVETTVYSNYTANDNGRLLYNTLKELANAALLNVTDGTDKFEQTIVTVTLNPVV